METTWFNEEVILEDELVRLEPLTVDHLNSLWNVAQEHILWNLTTSNIKSKEDLEKYITKALAEKTAAVSYPFAVFHKALNEFVGSTRYGNISYEHKRVEIGWTWYATKVQGTALNVHCKFLLLRYAFETLGCMRVELKTAHNNLRSQNAIKKIGGIQEGVLRKHMINPDGSIRDSIYFSIIDTEWPGVKKRLIERMAEKADS